MTAKHDPSTNQPLVLIVLCGPTAVGKTELALQIAERFACEIISVDSMQVYRHMDIGTAKPTPTERARIPHHLIDIAEPDENYTMGRFVVDAEAAIATIAAHDKIPLLAGGTGLYFKGLLSPVFDENGLQTENKADAKMQYDSIRQNLRKKLMEEGSDKLHGELAAIDPVSAKRIHPNDTQRLIRGLEIYYVTGIPWSRHLENQVSRTVQYHVLKIGLTMPRHELYNRIGQRVQHMADHGLLDEVKNLVAMGYNSNLKSMQSIGYRHMLNFIAGTWSWEKTLEILARDTRRYAKRQYTWFNSDPEIIWHDVREADTVFAAVEKFLADGDRT